MQMKTLPNYTAFPSEPKISRSQSPRGTQTLSAFGISHLVMTLWTLEMPDEDLRLGNVICHTARNNHVQTDKEHLVLHYSDPEGHEPTAHLLL